MFAGLNIQRGMLLLGDTVMILVSFQLAAFLRFDTTFNVFAFSTGASVFMLLVYIIMLYICDLYTLARGYSWWTLAFRLTVVIGLTAILSAALFYWLPGWKHLRGIYLLQMPLTGVSVFGWRYFTAFFFPRAFEKEKIIIVGAGYAGVTLCNLLESTPETTYKVVGFVDDDAAREIHVRGISRFLGTVNDLLEIAREQGVSTVLLAITDNRTSGLMHRLLHLRCKGITILDMAPVLEKLLGRIPVHHIRVDWLIFAPGFYLLSKSYVQKIKRLMDVGSATVLLVVSLPVMLLTALAIRIESRGPALFKQTRVGVNDTPFTILKFRSMVQDAEKNGAVWATENDPRVTRVGKLIRLLRIDELPQLLNVFRGEMSMIGPRPERPEFVAELQQQIPYYSIRHMVRPGITGLAQVSYRYGASVTDALHKLEYDLYYIKNMSLLLDFSILFKTVGVVLFGKGAR